MPEYYGLEFSTPNEFIVRTTWNLGIFFVGAVVGMHVLAEKVLAAECHTPFGLKEGTCQTLAQTANEMSLAAAAIGGWMIVGWAVAYRMTSGEEE